MRGGWFVVLASGCGVTPEVSPAKSSTTLPEVTLASATVSAHAPAPCPRGAHDRIGELRFALIAPLNTPDEDLAVSTFEAAWRGGTPTIAMSATTQRALATLYGAHTQPSSEGRPDVTADRWAIVPVDELSPHWKVVTVGGSHPLAATDDGPLTVPMCGRGAHVTNFDPAKLTTVAMTGVTAMARFTAKLIDRKGTAYPVRDVAPWFAGTDFVHVSNEVSFYKNCDPKGEATEAFCSRDSYIEVLDALGTDIVEQTGSHLQDFGRETMTRSIEMYEARGWKVFGGGRDQIEATRPLLVEHHGNKLAFLGCNMPRSTEYTIRSGVEVGFCDKARLDYQIRDLRARGYIPIVSLQHEEVYAHEPPDVLVRDFRHLAEVGAAVVFGSQAHWAHPFEVHANAFVHYGAGNFIFDQSWAEVRDATQDRFYFYDGRLLTVGQLFTRLEEAGRPRPMTDKERAGFLRTLDTALGTLPKADPFLDVKPQPPEPVIPDSFLVGTDAIRLSVMPPASSAAPAPLVIDLRAKPSAVEGAYCVTLRKPPKLTGAKLTKAITEFMTAKYGIDPARVTVR